MEAHHLAEGTHGHRLQQARQLYFSEGRLPDGLVTPAILRSWQRCRSLGLAADEPAPAFVRLDTRALQEQQELNRQLLSHGRAVIGLVHEQINESGSMVSLCDANGSLLENLGDADFVGQAGRLALAPGACWEESFHGTNAIGTALVEETMVQVLGGEHYASRNAFLACCAKPIYAPDGTVLGVFNIASDYQGHERHMRGLVGLAATLVENRIFEATHAGDMLFTFQRVGARLGGPADGLLAVSADGLVRAINRAGLAILGIRRVDAVPRDFAFVFEYRLGLLIDHLRNDPQASHELSVSGKALRFQWRGHPLPRFVVSRFDDGAAATATPPAGTQAPTLEQLDSGDPGLHGAIGRARRILGRDIPLLIQGESGAGKELFAKGFHNSGPRRNAAFVALNCAAIPEHLIEAELFGYQGGAFTGARKEGAPGKIQQAHGGTLFLDEIGDMPIALQSRLLRVLQERSVTPLGASRSIPVDISLVCATHRHLREEVAAGSFREDLYYRLNGLCITLPPLRERSDLRLLVGELASRETVGRAPVRFAEETLRTMERYPWPGNLRQLFNVIRVTIALLDDDETLITNRHLPEELFETPPVALAGRTAVDGAAWAAAPPEFGYSLDDIGCQITERTLAAAGGNISAAARQLGISRNTLYRKLRKLATAPAAPPDQPPPERRRTLAKADAGEVSPPLPKRRAA